MIIGIEETPQLQPAVCSFSGHGAGSCDKFIRVLAPEDYYDTILISNHFFKQMADEMGYVELKHETKLLIELQERFNELAPTVHSFLSELALLGKRFDNLQALETNLSELKSTMESIVRASQSSKSTVKPDSSKHPSGISSSTSKSATVVDLFD